MKCKIRSTCIASHATYFSAWASCFAALLLSREALVDLGLVIVIKIKRVISLRRATKQNERGQRSVIAFLAVVNE